MILETSIASMNVLYLFICDSYGQVAEKWNPVVDSTLAKIFRALSLVRNPTDFRRFPFELHQIIRSEIYFDKKNISGHNHIKSKIFPFIARIAEIPWNQCDKYQTNTVDHIPKIHPNHTLNFEIGQKHFWFSDQETMLIWNW